MVVGDTTVNGAGSSGKLHERVTFVAPVKLVPVMVAIVPAGPLVGLTVLIVGRGGGGGGGGGRGPPAVTVKLPGRSTPPAPNPPLPAEPQNGLGF
jgi:hypothetical protein